MNASLPKPKKPKNQQIEVDLIDVGDRRRKVDEEKMFALAADMREHGLLQPIGVRQELLNFTLIWGAARLRAARYLMWNKIACRVYPYDLHDELLVILEIVENLKRQELTTEEREAQTLELAAALKRAQEAGSTDRSDSEQSEVKPRGHRQPKGIVREVAEQLGKDPSAVRQATKKASAAIGEPVDLQDDSPDELERKAAARRTAPKPPKAKAAPKPRLAPVSKPKRLEDLIVMLRQLEADWPKQLRVEVPSFQRQGLLETVRRLRERLGHVETALLQLEGEEDAMEIEESADEEAALQ